MWDILFYLIIIAFLAAAAGVAAMFVRGYLTGVSPAAAIFGPRPEKRLDVVEQSSVDGRRRLVLIRRDDVEHLIMTGGPVDVVIETNIAPRPARPIEAAEPSATIFSRIARPFGQSAGEPRAQPDLRDVLPG